MARGRGSCRGAGSRRSAGSRARSCCPAPPITRWASRSPGRGARDAALRDFEILQPLAFAGEGSARNPRPGRGHDGHGRDPEPPAPREGGLRAGRVVQKPGPGARARPTMADVVEGDALYAKARESGLNLGRPSRRSPPPGAATKVEVLLTCPEIRALGLDPARLFLFPRAYHPVGRPRARGGRVSCRSTSANGALCPARRSSARKSG